MKIKTYILLLAVGCLLGACEKDLEKYSGIDYIHFVPEFAKDSVEYNFGLMGQLTTDRIGIEVKITGELYNYDRAYWLSVNSKTTAIEGRHFAIPQKNIIMRVGHVTDTLWIEITNTDELRNERVYLQLDLEENDNFKLCFPDHNSCKIYLSDNIERPEWWDEWHETEGLGSYSEIKYRLLVRVSGIADLGSVEYPERREAILKLKYYLEEEADKGNVIMDEDNTPMKVAMYG